MAQVGSYVPASSAKLHVFDSVQTRMGASYSLQKGSSTFFEELSETSTILSTATCRSLVILDELGGGTSTHDGVAIAYATLHYLLKETKCLTLFVTHYPKIAELKDEFPREVNPYYVCYMAHESEASNQIAVDSMEGVDDTSKDSKAITFLYKLVPGVASKSFGLYVARLAQIPEPCVLRAATMVAEFEKAVSNQNKLKATSDCVERTPDKLALLECRNVTRSFGEGEPNERMSLGSRDVSRNCVDVATYSEVTFDNKAVHGNSVDDFGESETAEIKDTKLAITFVENIVGNSSTCTPIDEGESASIPEAPLSGLLVQEGLRKRNDG